MNFDKNDKGKEKVCVFSFNSRGFREEKANICKTLFMENSKYFPVLCNQENFILKGNNYKINQCLPSARIFFKEAMKDSLEGRPKNGMFVAIPKEIKERAKDVSPNHWRVQAITLDTGNSKILIINSYFPTDPRTNEFDTKTLWKIMITTTYCGVVI